MTRSPESRSRGPWVDLHAHPGRFFLEGTDREDRVGPIVADPDVERAHAEATSAGMAAVAYATVADYPVLGVQPGGGLAAVRDFDRGEAYFDHVRQLGVVRDVSTRTGATIATRAADIEQAHAEGRTCLLVTCEGADFAETDLALVAEAQEAGVRSITLVHYRQNAFGDTQTSPPVHEGLSPLGRVLVKEANRAGVIIDLAHASYDTTLDVLAESTQPVMISHSHLGGGHRDSPRLLSVEHAAAVAAEGGVVGAWPSGVSSESFDDFVEEIARLVDAIGVDHVGIGTDMDANYRPVLTTYDQFAALETSLSQRGFSDAEVDKILGGNAVGLVRAVCG